MSKYAPLQEHLEKSHISNVPMTFAEIELVIGFDLPPSSRAHRAWWSNNPNNNVMTKAWLKAGYKTEFVDITAEKLVFQSVKESDNAAKNARTVDDLEKKPRRHPLFGCLEGTVTIPDDLDLTLPADPEWGKINE